MQLFDRYIATHDYMIGLMLDRDMDCLAWIERRDELEVQRYQWSRFVESIPYYEGTL